MSRFFALSAVAVAAACGGGNDGPSFADAHPRVYIQAVKDRLNGALASPAGTRFKTMVDKWVNGADVYLFPAWYAALMGQLSGDAKYCTAAVAAVDKQVATAESAISSGSAPEVAGDDYLQIGEMIGDLALTYDWCYDAIPGDRRTAWLGYAQQAVSNVWNPDTASWGGKKMPWTGWAIDDPSDNYYYSFLRATMLLGLAAHDEVDGAKAWLTMFHDTKLMGELVPTFQMDLTGGGSREGTGYGVSMRRLWEIYDLWHQSTGEDISTKTDHTRASMLDFIHQTMPTLDRIAPIGDQSRDSTASFFDYHRNYLQELVSLFPSDPLAPRVQALLAKSSVPKMGQQFMYGYDFLYDNSSVTATSLDGLGTAYYAPGTGQLYARSGWDSHATWINLTAGPYTQSHAHQDQGALMIYKDGWLGYDAVIDSKSGLRQEVDAHGAIRLVGLEQQLGKEGKLVALHRGTGWLYAAADVTGVYDGKAGKVVREIVYLEPDTVVVYDRVSSTQGQVWQLPMPAQPQISGTQTTLTTDKHAMHIERLAPTSATSSIHNFTDDSDFIGGFRLDETMPAGDQTWLHTIWIDGAVTAESLHDPNSVQITLASGTNVMISFTPDAIGGTLMFGSQNVQLAAGVDSLPE